MVRRLIFLLLLFPLFLIPNCVLAHGSKPLQSADLLAQQRWVDSVFNSLSLRERIAQLFMVAAYSNGDAKHVSEISNLITSERIGGVLFFQGGPVRQAKLTNRYQMLSKVPLMVAMDAEWGLGMRLDSTFSYPRQMMMGAQPDSNLVYAIASDIAQQLRRIGVHVNFAPVVDVNCNPQNPVIHTRAFGEDIAIIVKHGLAYVNGLQDNGIMAVAKHFPGHGDTFVDSHLDMPRINHDSVRLHNVELLPFRKMVEGGVQGVMVSHLKVPSLDPDTTLPATLSHKMLNQLLIGQMGFEGLVFTDAMNMKGVTKYFGNIDANVKAILAGNDVIEFALDIKKSIDRIEKMVQSGEIDESIITVKCRKILNAKFALGLSRYKPIVIDGIYSDLNTPKSLALCRRLIANGLTLLTNQNNILPLQRLDTLDIAYVEVGVGMGNAFYNQLKLYAPVTKYSIDAGSPEFMFDSLMNQLESHNLVIVGYHQNNNVVRRNYGVTQQLANFLFDLSFRKRVVLDVFGNPYLLTKLYNLSSQAAVVVSYDNSPDVQNLSAQLIFGGIAAKGRMPVSMSNFVVGGAGHQTKKRVRLGYAIPEELGIDSRQLLTIDSIVNSSLSTGAMPGVQILAAKDGVVFYHRAFGRPTYQSPNMVDCQMLYDVASVTKVTSTLPLVMRLNDGGRLPLTSKLGRYTNLKGYPDKAGIVIRDLLLHRAGLVPWIPFYLNTLTTIAPNAPLYQENLSTDYPYMISQKRYMSRYVQPSPVYYQRSQSFAYPSRVAENMYAAEGIVDTIFTRINRSELKDAGKYRYSDFSFIYLQRVVENIERDGLSNLSEKYFYRRLGMNYTCFRPLERFPRERIAPTEYDITFRHQLLWGDVHDQAAAMMGGVSGHAGLFSNANDMAKFMQMLLWKGEYGGERYFSPKTVDLFTAQPADSGTSRRALGFDRPSFGGVSTPCGTLASSKSFGHQGFTGTIVWADPKTGLVFVLLTNRVYPDASNNKMLNDNVRTKIHDIFYRAIGVLKE